MQESNEAVHGTPARQGRRMHGQKITCGWCGEPADVPARGRVPKWCSPACRQRAWQHKKATEAGRAPVEVVQQKVEVYRGERVVDKVVRGPVKARPKTGAEWTDMLQKLAWALSTNRLNEAEVRMIETHLYSVTAALDRRRHELEHRR